jgi:hypothetical protein
MERDESEWREIIGQRERETNKHIARYLVGALLGAGCAGGGRRQWGGSGGGWHGLRHVHPRQHLAKPLSPLGRLCGPSKREETRQDAQSLSSHEKKKKEK